MSQKPTCKLLITLSPILWSQLAAILTCQVMKSLEGTSALAAGRRPPLLPEDFSNILQSRNFTGRGDKEKVKELYKKIFLTIAASAAELDFNSLGWGDEEAADLAKVLPSFRKVTYVFLGGNKIGDAGAAAIAAALPGSMVESLLLGSNCIGYAGAASLAEILLQTKHWFIQKTIRLCL